MSAPRALLETVRLESGAALRLPRHRARMAASAAALAIPWSGAGFEACVAGALAEAPRQGAARMRVVLGEGGELRAETAPYREPPEPLRLLFSGRRVDGGDPWVRHKVLPRGLYDAVRCEAEGAGFWDGILSNTLGEVCETGRANLVALVGGALLTPALTSGLLPGTVRDLFLESGLLREEVLRPGDLEEAEGLFVTNALVGVREVGSVAGSRFAPRQQPAAAALARMRAVLG